MASLFREQVIRKRRDRLYGDIVIADTRINSVFVTVMGLFSLALILWAVNASYPRTAQIPGTVVTSLPSAKVFAARAGTIERLYVREGSQVRKGQPIAFIGVDMRDGASRGSAGETLTALGLQSDTIDQQLDAEARTAADEERRLTTAIASNAAESQSLSHQLDLQTAIVRSMSETLERIQPIADRGYISKLEMERRRQALYSEQQRAEQLRQQRTQLAARQSDLTAQLHQLPLVQRQKSAELRGQLLSLSQQQSRARVEVGYTIVAPIDGRITALQATIGRNVDARIPLMVVVPDGSAFEAELFAPSRSAGFIRDGQAVRIMYDAFPYKQFGSFDGRILNMSKAAFTPGELDTPLKIEEPVYKVRVKLARQIVPAFGRPLHLQTGMSLTATVILERRSFLDWVLEPLNAVRRRS
ncbi:hypothetical protein AWL63_18395 [Sphingomonas panacis]|uniref:Uncharacterized protein n=1 Tax=Sphingomonas panacis TaxID=1560345 RepID=A0A1B3ZDY0_9SPHN|nr:HlyD family efflux transporter periplasmic adaptor subunit [Sphingomonas panacis]AOH85612.1 hypothetical protein AWL63_18395 [Sphingomonas panacis]